MWIHSELLILDGSSIKVSTKTAPPMFREDVAYKTWTNNPSVTKVPKKEQAIVALLEALEGSQKAVKAVSDVTATQLNVDDGLKVLRNKLNIQPFK